MLPMAGCHPQFGVVNVWRDDFLEASLSVLASDKGYELIIDESALRIEEAASRAEFVKEEKILLLTDLSVITLSSLFLEMLPLFQLL